MTEDWDETFESVLRPYLPTLPEGAPLAPDLVTAAFGLNSVATVGLIAALEDAYGVTFPDEDLVPANFRTPGSVWALLTRLRATSGRP
ncbi:acyl carrier protein [Microbispora sp. NPDC046973]|uniref:acyl carrier protein n=1 Tax=Microbispora sp. NPDC046973 TaxID=3155022 RepID=UPI0033C2B9A1